MWSVGDIVLIAAAVVAGLVALMYFLNRRANKKLTEQQDIIDKNKMVQSIFIIDKKKDKIENVNMPKAVVEQMPKIMKIRKMYFVKAKIGPQIMTFMCDKKIFEALPIKKNTKVELVGIYILGFAGQKNSDDKKDLKSDNKDTGFFRNLKSKLVK